MWLLRVGVGSAATQLFICPHWGSQITWAGFKAVQQLLGLISLLSALLGDAGGSRTHWHAKRFESRLIGCCDTIKANVVYVAHFRTRELDVFYIWGCLEGAAPCTVLHIPALGWWDLKLSPHPDIRFNTGSCWVFSRAAAIRSKSHQWFSWWVTTEAQSSSAISVIVPDK